MASIGYEGYEATRRPSMPQHRHMRSRTRSLFSLCIIGSSTIRKSSKNA